MTDNVIFIDDGSIQAHLDRQKDDFNVVVMADGTVRPFGGRVDREDGDDSE